MKVGLIGFSVKKGYRKFSRRTGLRFFGVGVKCDVFSLCFSSGLDTCPPRSPCFATWLEIIVGCPKYRSVSSEIRLKLMTHKDFAFLWWSVFLKGGVFLKLVVRYSENCNAEIISYKFIRESYFSVTSVTSSDFSLQCVFRYSSEPKTKPIIPLRRNSTVDLRQLIFKARLGHL